MKALYKILALSAVVALTGCAKETATKDAETVNSGKVSLRVFTNETKVTLDTTGTTYPLSWEKGDVINVSDGTSTYTFEASEAGTDVIFTGESELKTGTTYGFHGDKFSKFDGSVATASVDASQSGLLSEVGNNFASYAYDGENNPCTELEFTPAVSLLKFKVVATNVPTAITFEGVGGSYTVDTKEGTVEAVDAVDVSISGIEANTTYFAVVVPGEYKNGIQISYTLNGEEIDYLAPKTGITIEPGMIYNVGTINLNTWKLVDSNETLDECGDGQYMIAYWDGATLRALSLENLAANADEVATIFQGGEGFQYFRSNAKKCYNTLVAKNYIDITEYHKGTDLTGDETLITLPEDAETAVKTITMSGDDVTVENNYSLTLSISSDDENRGLGIDIDSDGYATIKGAFDVESVIGVVTKLNETEPAWTVQTIVEAFASEDAARTHLYNMAEQMGFRKTQKLLDIVREEADKKNSMAVAACDLQNVVFDTTKDGFTLRCKTWDQMKADQILEVVNGYLNTTTDNLDVTDYTTLADLINSYLGTSFTVDQIQKAFETVGTDGKANWDALIAKYKTKIMNWEEKIKTYVGKGSETGDRYKNVQLWYKVGSGKSE